MRHLTRRSRFGLGLLLSLTFGVLPVMEPPAHAAGGERSGPKNQSDFEAQQQLSNELRQLARQKREESITRLKGLIANEDGDRRAEMMLRLAQLYYEQGRDLYLGEMETFNEAYDRCFNTDGCDPDALEANHGGSRTWYGKAITLYENILRSYPRYARSDQATFFLGMTYDDIGQKEKALAAYKKLVKLYPQSRFVADGYVLIGDYYFEKNEAFPALQAFKRATNFKDSERYPYAMYKLAWTYYNVEEYGKAIDTMKAVVAYSMETGDQAEGTLRLEEEALKDLVRFFADAGEMDEAYEYFTKLGKKNLIRSMLQRLAGLYDEQGKNEQAVDTYRRLIAEDPNHPSNPEYQDSIILSYRRMGDEGAVLSEIRRLRTEYGPESSWARANAAEPEALAEAADIVERSLRRTATAFNEEARRLSKARHPRASEMYGRAMEAYDVYLADYNDHENAYNVWYDYAELLYKTKRYQDAYNAYMRVVEIDPQGQHSRFCAESAIFAAEELVKAEGGGQITTRQVKVTKDVQPLPLTDSENKLIAACKQYADLYPSDSKVEIAIYKSAYLLYQRFHFPEAAEQFQSVIAMNPRSQNAERSAHLILDALRIREEWTSLRDTSKAFWQQQGMGSSKFKSEMHDIYSASSFKVIEVEFAENKDHGKTADDYVAFYEEFPDFDKVDVALNNAAAYYFKANRVADATKIRHILVDDPKFGAKSKYYFSQLGFLGFDYERVADFEQASNYYDRMVSQLPAEKTRITKAESDTTKRAEQVAKVSSDTADALFSSAVFHDARGDWKDAVSRFQKFIAMFPADERVTDVKLRIGNIQEREEAWSDAAKTFYAFFSDASADTPAEYVFFARLHYGRALLAQRRTSDARDHYRKTVALYDKLTAGGLAPGAHTEFVAEMMFELAKPKLDSYLAKGINGGAPGASRRVEDKAFTRSLKQKRESLLDVESTFSKIASTGSGEWGLASLVALGKAYENMSDTFLNSPSPSYLTDDQLEFYRMGMEDAAYPQVEKAVEAYRVALEKSYELNLYNEDMAFATRRLGELRPDDFPGLEEEIPSRRYSAQPRVAFGFETSLD